MSEKHKITFELISFDPLKPVTGRINAEDLENSKKTCTGRCSYCEHMYTIEWYGNSRPPCPKCEMEIEP